MTKHTGPTRGILRSSVWARDGIRREDERVRGLLRVALPSLDGALILFGIGGGAFGIPALRDVFDGVYAQGWSYGLAAASAACLVGLAWPRRLWRLERSAKALLAWMLTVYAGALMWAGFLTSDLGRSAVGFIPLALVPIIVWRIVDVTRDAKRNGWPGAPG